VLTLTDFFLPCARINLIDAQDRICGGPDGGARCADVCLAAPWTPDGYRQRYEQAAALLAGAAERVAPSRFVAQRFEASFAQSAFKVVPHGIDLIALTNASPRSAEAALRSDAMRADEAGGPLKLLFVGSIVPQKGLHVLLGALAAMPRERVSLRVVGGFYGNAGYHDELKEMVQADGRVTLAGRMDAAGVHAAMQQADLLCIPSQVPESFSLVLNEAAAAGLPALVTDLGASAQRVKDSGAGAVIAPGDVMGWAQAIAAVAREPAQLARWRELLPLPPRIEEEAFFYDALWRRVRRPL
jgi:glycosyltransferase involved in cell wall biosynthesis